MEARTADYTICKYFRPLIESRVTIAAMLASHFRNSVILTLAATAIVAGHLLPGLDTSEIQNGIRNSLHIIVFAAFAGFVFNRLQNLFLWPAIGVTVIVVGTVAVSAELLQYFKGASPAVDLGDLVRDGLGAVLSITAITFWKKSRSNAVLRATSIIMGGLIFVPLIFWLAVIIINRTMFPSLLTFERWWETFTYSGINTTVNTDTAATFTPNKTYRSGLSIRPLVSDWENHTYLTFTAAVEGQSTKLTLRINDSSTLGWMSKDAMHEIYITTTPEHFRLPLSELTIIPKKDSAKLSDVTQIVILTPRNRKESTIILDDLRLE